MDIDDHLTNEKNEKRLIAFIEGLFSLMSENKSNLILDETVQNHFAALVQEFKSDAIDFEKFIDCSMAYGFVSSIHWNPETKECCKDITYSKLLEKGISLPNFLAKEKINN